jgi:hypothetical protein
MAKHSDQELLRALVHDAHLLASTAGEIHEHDAAVIKEQLGIAEEILAGVVTEEGRRRVYDLLHPATLNLYLPD